MENAEKKTHKQTNPVFQGLFGKVYVDFYVLT